MAYEVEAALIDAYPGLTNQVGGHDSGDYGTRHVEEIIAEYGAEPFEVKEPLILISIGASYNSSKNIYDAVRCAWKVDPNRVKQYKLVLAHVRGMVVGAFHPTEWLPATSENFPGRMDSDVPDRWGFVGESAEPAVAQSYMRKLVPDRYRRRGAANPVRYCEPNQA